MIAEKIRNELTSAMKARETLRVSVLRGLLAGFTNELVAQKKKPDEKIDDESALLVIKRGVKPREDSIEQFEKGGRKDLADNEKAELAILKTYLPETMKKEDIRTVVETKKQELQISDTSKAGILIGAVMKELKGKADGKDVKEVVDELLS
ncbi:GatB/YqeY domain-containing protein [Candidatus Kaiserbacteria bacterium]|nr:GatB/YqeY domain-containing protein [Candidatus Kaiserbacteria bacterium]